MTTLDDFRTEIIHSETSGSSENLEIIHSEVSGSSENLETEIPSVSVSEEINASTDLHETVQVSENAEPVVEDAPSESTETEKETTVEVEEWMDIIGSGDFKKKIIKAGENADSRPKKGDLVSVNITVSDMKGNLIEQNENLQFIIGDLDVIQGLDLAVNLMWKGEKAKILIPSRLAYGKLGRSPDISPECDLDCDVELLDVDEMDEADLTLQRRLDIGNEKRNKGNFYYDRSEYISAIHCYERAVEYLDGIQNCSNNSATELQHLLDMKIKVYNNMAAAHLKLEAFDAALLSLDFVLKVQPKNVKAHFRKGKILASKGLTEEAIACMKVAANLEPETKVIQDEISRLVKRKKYEDNSQRAMYKRMFGETSTKKMPSNRSKMRYWSTAIAGGVITVILGMVAYKQMHS